MKLYRLDIVNDYKVDINNVDIENQLYNNYKLDQ